MIPVKAVKIRRYPSYYCYGERYDVNIEPH